MPLRTSTLTLLKIKMGHFAALFKDKRANFMTLIQLVSHRELINFSNIMELDFLKNLLKTTHCQHYNSFIGFGFKKTPRSRCLMAKLYTQFRTHDSEINKAFSGICHLSTSPERSVSHSYSQSNFYNKSGNVLVFLRTNCLH